MRQARKRELLNFIDSLHEAHCEIKKAMEKRETASVQNMLSECQEFVVDLGNVIEESEGESCITVSYVEEYCETIYHVYESVISDDDPHFLNKNVTYDASKAYKILRKQLLRVEQSVKNDIRTRREIAFFPYNASMWDSLESVYLAAKEDLNCDAYCVPIPYFELKPDHSFGVMRYEGGKFPKNIEIVDWQRYNFEERRPDIIFIHNPYDEWNHVTSVHPRFYARNVKKYTDKLVYIPYFVLKEMKPDDSDRQKWIERMKHFCFMPGTIYADKVILQSENMRQIYIDEYKKEATAIGLTVTRRELEEKFLGLGTPKLDKVSNRRKEDYDIPKEWRKIIQKRDGNFKKVVFYNTGISALLIYCERWLDKIEDVLGIFKENQDEIALLWRPHPLIESTIMSMRPELIERYRRIKDGYIKEGWGIYDNSADLDRAVVLSDVYYGDESSVIRLHQKKGNPILRQDITMNRDIVNAKMDAVALFKYIRRGKKFIGKQLGLKGVVIGDQDSGICTLVHNMKSLQRDGVASIDIGKIYFPPMESGFIEIYDEQTGKTETVELPNDEDYYVPNKFYSIAARNGKVYMLPGRYPYIVEYDCVYRSLKRYELESWIIETGKLIFAETIGILKDKVYAVSWIARVVVSVELCEAELKINYHKISKQNGGYRSICIGQNGMYVSDSEGNIILVEKGEGSYIEKVLYSDEKAVYRKCIKWDDCVYFFDENSYCAIVIDEEKKTVNKKVLHENNDIAAGFGQPQIIENHIELFDLGRKLLLWLNKDLETLREVACKINKIEMKEEDIIPVKDYISKYIFHSEYAENDSDETTEKNELCGQRIYDVIAGG